MKLYIANLSLQHAEIQYRVPEVQRVQMALINPFTQRLIVDDQPEIARGIIDQLAVFGLVSDREMLRVRRFTGMCYRLRSPVSIETLLIANAENKQRLVDAGHADRQEAVAAMATLEMHRATRVGLGAVTAFAATVREQHTGRADDGPRLRETIVSVAEGHAPPAWARA